MRSSLKYALAATAVTLCAAPAMASVIYNNDPSYPPMGDCSFSTQCAATTGAGNDFAAQAFTTTTTEKVTDAAFIEVDKGTRPTFVTYRFYTNVGGLPGVLLHKGSSPLTATVLAGLGLGRYETRESFTVRTFKLPPGSYFMVIQATSTSIDNYLMKGVASSGAAETHNGGKTWTPNYSSVNFPSVAVTVSGLP